MYKLPIDCVRDGFAERVDSRLLLLAGTALAPDTVKSGHCIMSSEPFVMEIINEGTAHSWLSNFLVIPM